MSLISATELQLSFGLQVVLDGATLAISEGEKVGLVGRNGCGKSSFLKILAGMESPDGGEVARRRELAIGYLAQEFELDDEATVIENIRAGAADLIDWLARYGASRGSAEELHRLEDRIEARDGWNLDAHIRTLMTELSAPDETRRVGELSGGEKRRVALCRALAPRPDLLILDEPTNHLDADSITWLEDYLRGSRGACLFVTHDRYFLDRIATRIAELDGGRFFTHNGSYGSYLEAKAERKGREQASESRRQSFLRRELSWVRAGVKARTTKSRHRMDSFHKIAGEKAPEKEVDVELLIPPAPRLANIVVNAAGIGMSLGGKRLFGGLELQFEPGQCTGIVGRNGLGKSTLLKILMGQLEPDEGTVTIGKRTEFSYIDQSRMQLDGERSMHEEVGENSEMLDFGGEQISTRGYLKRFLFTDERISMRIDRLSGGERSRVLLAKMLKKRANFLVLDEPTNDLDLATMRILEEALASFDGCVVVVSHDRYFLDRICSRIVAFEGDGRVYVQPGNYSYYVEKRKERGVDRKPAEGAKQDRSKKRDEGPQKLKWKEERELEGMEEKIEKVEARVTEIEGLFSDPAKFAEIADRAGEMDEERTRLVGEIEALYARWEKLEGIRVGSEET